MHTTPKFEEINCKLSGSPIRDFNIEFEDTANNYYTKDEAVYKIPVKGPDGHGYYFIKAQPRGEGGKWVGVKLELELEETKHLEKEKFQNKRLVVFDCDKNGFMDIKMPNRNPISMNIRTEG